ncbi:MAG: YrbL family protein [Enterobacteriaceae bacterium]
MSGEIILTEQDLLAKGNDRSVYRHPQQSHLLIKVVRRDIAKYRSKCREMRRELKECVPITHEDCTRLQTIYGLVPTNLGLGQVIAKEQDHRGHLAPTLYDIALTGRLSQKKMRELLQFIDWFVHTKVLINSLHCKNIVYAWDQELGEPLFKVIDGFGDKTWLQLSKISPHIRAWNKQKCLKRMLHHLDQLLETAQSPPQVSREYQISS